MRPSEDGVAGHRSERAGRRGGAKRALQASCEHTSEPSARVVPISYKYSCSEHEGSTVAIAETIGLSTRRGQHPSAPWHGSTGTNANSMSDATSGARAGRRHDRRSAYRRDGGSTRARLGMAAPARTQILCRTPRAELGRAGGTIGDRPIDATGAGSERVLAWQRGSAVFECGGTASAAWAGSSAGTIIGSIRGRHERGLGRQFFGTISRSNAEAPRARLGQVVAPARSSDRFGGRSTMVTSA